MWGLYQTMTQQIKTSLSHVINYASLSKCSFGNGMTGYGMTLNYNIQIKRNGELSLSIFC